MITYMQACCRGGLCFPVEAAKYEQQDGTEEMPEIVAPSAATETIFQESPLTIVDNSCCNYYIGIPH